MGYCRNGWWGKRKYEEAKDKVFPELKNQEYNLLASTDDMFNNLDKVLNDMENPNKNITLLSNMMGECQKKVNEVNQMINGMSEIRTNILTRYKALGDRLNKIKTVNDNPVQQPQQKQDSLQQITPAQGYDDPFLQQQEGTRRI